MFGYVGAHFLQFLSVVETCSTSLIKITVIRIYILKILINNNIENLKV